MKIEGKNCVLEALRSQDTTVNGIMCAKGCVSDITALAKSLGVKITYVDKSVLDKESVDGRHQGYIADVVDFDYCDLEDVIAAESGFVVILDGVCDPHNFGSIIRSCECVGVSGIVIGRNRQVAVTETVARCSAGAVSHVKIAKVTNVNNAIEQLQQNGFWVYALDMDGEEITKTDLSGKVALVVGGEGSGVSALTRKRCDGIVSLPLKGKVNSLNASVACGVALYEVVRQRGNAR